jgi:hypothetical protein
LRAREVNVGNPEELDVLRRIGLQIPVDARVIAAKGSRAYNSNPQNVAAIRHLVIVAHGRVRRQKDVADAPATRR